MEITGAFWNLVTGSSSGYMGSANGAFSVPSQSTSDGTLYNDGGDSLKTKGDGIKFQASKNWSGSTSGGTAHHHSFSNAATIGSGDYTRPNSVTAVMLIKY